MKLPRGWLGDLGAGSGSHDGRQSWRSLRIPWPACKWIIFREWILWMPEALVSQATFGVTHPLDT